MDFQILNIVIGVVNALAAAFIWWRGQPKFAMLAGLLWVAFAVTQNLTQAICGFFGLATVVASYSYFSWWQSMPPSEDRKNG